MGDLSILRAPPSAVPDQTPLFYAMQNQRYARRRYIEDIEGITGRKLIVYFSKPEAAIEQPDVMAFGDLLDNVGGKDVDLLLQSPGGDIDVAEKLVNLISARCRSFRVIVAQSAKSAATLMALASDEIVMSDTSELGPIDPQVTVTTAQGQRIARPAASFLDGLKWIQQEGEGGELPPVFFLLLANLDPALLDYCRKAIERSERFAEKWLLRSQCKDQAKVAKKIAKRLADTEQYLSHGTMIDHKEAADLGLKVKYCQHDEELWQRIWRLYCMYEIDAAANGVTKVFESSKVSLLKVAAS